MVVTVRSLGLTGITGYEVSVECVISGGLPAFDVVGLPDAAVKEARERVRAAVKNCGEKFPVSRAPLPAVFPKKCGGFLLRQPLCTVTPPTSFPCGVRIFVHGAKKVLK